MVALFTRAWIEIKQVKKQFAVEIVALFTRAWIEILKVGDKVKKGQSRPLHEGVD